MIDIYILFDSHFRTLLIRMRDACSSFKTIEIHLFIQTESVFRLGSGSIFLVILQQKYRYLQIHFNLHHFKSTGYEKT